MPELSPRVVEKPYRSLIKAVSWRTTGTLDTMLVSYIITGSLEAAFSIGMIEVITKMGLYYVHERVWLKLPFGREVVKPPDYEI